MLLTAVLFSTAIGAQSGPGPLVTRVAVVVEMTLAANSSPAEALEAMNALRTVMKKQAGYLSEEFLQNLNPDNAPQYVHVSRWVAMDYWAAFFRTPAFSGLNAHGNEHFTLSTSAFIAAE
jgi:heme-degrading monooxygenase HmoA